MDEFEKAYYNGLKGLKFESSGFSYTCQTCIDAHGFCCEHSAKAAWENNEISDEGSFSWDACDLCGSHLGGNRYSAHAVTDDASQDDIHLEICQDCLLYMANGDLPEEWEG